MPSFGFYFFILTSSKLRKKNPVFCLRLENRQKSRFNYFLSQQPLLGKAVEGVVGRQDEVVEHLNAHQLPRIPQLLGQLFVGVRGFECTLGSCGRVFQLPAATTAPSLRPNRNRQHLSLQYGFLFVAGTSSWIRVGGKPFLKWIRQV
jgi:hypothetical protein